MISTTYPSKEFSEAEREFESPVTQCMRRSPGTNLLVALGIGLAVGVVIHALRPAPKPRQRLTNMLEDLEDRLREIGEPAMSKVGSIAADGAHAFADQMHRREAQFEKLLRTASDRLRRLANF